MSACAEDELSFEGNRLGFFTDALLQVWEESREPLSFSDLTIEVNARTPASQTPACEPLSARWENEVMPF